MLLLVNACLIFRSHTIKSCDSLGKSGAEIGSDFFFGAVGAGTGGVVGKSGVGNGLQNSRNFVTEGTTQYMNAKVYDKLK